MASECDLMQFCPRYDDPAKDYVMVAGWLSCLRWAMGAPEIIARFERETGHHFVMRPIPSPLERMIDEACGVPPESHWQYVSAFARWFNENIWGDADEEE